jgi:hypothetical protein
MRLGVKKGKLSHELRSMVVIEVNQLVLDEHTDVRRPLFGLIFE